MPRSLASAKALDAVLPHSVSFFHLNSDLWLCLTGAKWNRINLTSRPEEVHCYHHESHSNWNLQLHQSRENPVRACVNWNKSIKACILYGTPIKKNKIYTFFLSWSGWKDSWAVMDAQTLTLKKSECVLFKRDLTFIQLTKYNWLHAFVWSNLL